MRKFSFIKNLLDNLPITHNCIIVLHVGLKGIKNHYKNYDISYGEISNFIIDFILKKYDPKGIIVPTFTYSFTRTKFFDLKNSKSEVGRFSEEIRLKYGHQLRTEDPIFSVIDCNNLLENVEIDISNAFSEKSLWGFLGREGHTILNINVNDLFVSTYIHRLEQKLNVPYRKFKDFKGTISSDGINNRNINYRYYARDLKIDPKWNRLKIINKLKKSKRFYEEIIDDNRVIVFDSKMLDQLLGTNIKKQKDFLIV